MASLAPNAVCLHFPQKVGVMDHWFSSFSTFKMVLQTRLEYDEFQILIKSTNFPDMSIKKIFLIPFKLNCLNNETANNLYNWMIKLAFIVNWNTLTLGAFSYRVYLELRLNLSKIAGWLFLCHFWPLLKKSNIFWGSSVTS